MNKRNPSISILKGIGIISVVLGHTCYWSVQYVYMYHLAIFFFVAGFLYNEKKYGHSVTTLFAARMHSIMPQYLLYSILLMLNRNWMLKAGLYNDTIIPFTTITFAQTFVAVTYFASTELVGSAFWFLPVLIVAIVLWGTIVSLSNCFCAKYVGLVRYTLTALMAYMGLLLIKNQVILSFHLEDSLLILPIIAYGNGIKKHYEWFLQKMNGWIAAVLMLIVFICPSLCGTWIELSVDRIINPFVFYFISWAGVTAWYYFSIRLSAICDIQLPQMKHFGFSNKLFKMICQILSTCGNYSLDIMALHLIIVKLIDYVYLEYIDPTAGVKSSFVYSVKELWPFYLTLGIILPITFRYVFNKIMERLKKIFQPTCIKQQNAL